MSLSIRQRFAFTLSANLGRAFLGFITGMLLARFLGPAAYGKMAFLLGTFSAVRQFLDMGSSAAFFTFMSQKLRSKRFVQYFFYWFALQFFLVLFVVGLLFPFQWIAAVWHGESRALVLLAFAVVFLQNGVWPVVQQAGESQRKTIWVQSIDLAIITAHILAVIALWKLGALGLPAIFLAIIIEYTIAIVVAHKQFHYAVVDEKNNPSVSEKEEPILKKYLTYCLPLMPYAWVSFAYEFSDRWLLQHYGGSIQQAYYAVGSQFSAIALIATSSILRIFWKEIAEAHYQKNHLRMKELYQKVSRLLFFVGAAIAGFLIPWTRDLLSLILGSAYVGGAITTAIMFLYPVHQSMGQIGGTMLYATEKISVQVISGIVFMASSIVVTYFVLASPDAFIPGLGLASIGLALKMVLLQCIQVNIIAYLIARIFGWPFSWLYQLVGLLGCLFLGWVVQQVVVFSFGSTFPLFITLGLSGVLYLFLIVLLVYTLPWLIGMTRENLLGDVYRVKQFILKFRN